MLAEIGKTAFCIGKSDHAEREPLFFLKTNTITSIFYRSFVIRFDFILVFGFSLWILK